MNTDSNKGRNVKAVLISFSVLVSVFLILSALYAGDYYFNNPNRPLVFADVGDCGLPYDGQTYIDQTTATPYEERQCYNVGVGVIGWECEYCRTVDECYDTYIDCECDTTTSYGCLLNNGVTKNKIDTTCTTITQCYTQSAGCSDDSDCVSNNPSCEKLICDTYMVSGYSITACTQDPSFTPPPSCSAPIPPPPPPPPPPQSEGFDLVLGPDQTITSGQTAVFTGTIDSYDGYSGWLRLTVPQCPPGASCTFTKDDWPLDGNFVACGASCDINVESQQPGAAFRVLVSNTSSLVPGSSYNVAIVATDLPGGDDADPPSESGIFQLHVQSGPAVAYIQGFKRVMPGNQNPGLNPPGNARITAAGVGSSTDNPYFIAVTPGQSYTATAENVSGYYVGYTLCIDSTNCHWIQSPTPGNSVTFAMPSGSGHYADLWWHYTPGSVCNESTVGDHRFEGCLYDGAYLNTLSGSAPAGSQQSTSGNNDTASGVLNQSWGNTNPTGADPFSARWKGNFTFSGGDYEFDFTGLDDGVRVWLADNPLAPQLLNTNISPPGSGDDNFWSEYAAGEHGSSNLQHVYTIPAGNHTLWVDFQDLGGWAEIRLSWNKVSAASTCTNSEGRLDRYYWNGISGTAVSALTGDARYPNSPSGSTQPTSFQAPVNFGSNYGTRMVGIVEAPETGNYRFYISSDDNSELWLNTAGTSESGKSRIAYENSWTPNPPPITWQTGNERSATIPLTAGQKYYIEALHKEAGGGDHLEVGWTTPSNSTISVIPGICLSTVGAAADYSFTVAPASRSFTAQQNGPTPAAQTVQVRNTGNQNLSFSVSDDANWMNPTPSTFNLAPGGIQTVSINITTTSLPPATRNGTVAFSAPNATNQTVAVSYQITNPQPTPDVAVDISAINGSGSFSLADIKDGDVLTIEIDFGNSGSGNATRIDSSIALSANLVNPRNFSCTSPCSGNVSSFSYTGSLAPGGTVTVRFDVTVQSTTNQQREQMTIGVSGDYDPGNIYFSDTYLLLITPDRSADPNFREIPSS